MNTDKVLSAGRIFLKHLLILISFFHFKKPFKYTAPAPVVKPSSWEIVKKCLHDLCKYCGNIIHWLQSWVKIIAFFKALEAVSMICVVRPCPVQWPVWECSMITRQAAGSWWPQHATLAHGHMVSTASPQPWYTRVRQETNNNNNQESWG